MLGVIQPFPLMISGRQRRFLQGQSFCQSGGEPAYNGRPFHLVANAGAQRKSSLRATQVSAALVEAAEPVTTMPPVHLGRRSGSRIGHDAAPGAQHVQKRLLDVPEPRDLFLFESKILVLEEGRGDIGVRFDPSTGSGHRRLNELRGGKSLSLSKDRRVSNIGTRPNFDAPR